jgi:hypothetical protein
LPYNEVIGVNALAFFSREVLKSRIWPSRGLLRLEGILAFDKLQARPDALLSIYYYVSLLPNFAYRFLHIKFRKGIASQYAVD